MKLRQRIENFDFSGQLVNTTVVEWIDEQRQGDARNAIAEDLAEIGDKVASGYLARIAADAATHQAALEKLTADHAAALAALREQLAAATSPPSPATGEISKLTLMRRLEALGKWTAFKALLAGLPESIQDAWTLAQSISATDPLFVQAAPTIKAALALTDEQFDALLE